MSDASATTPAAPRRQATDLPLYRKAYTLALLGMAGGFLLGMVTERAGGRLWPALIVGGAATLTMLLVMTRYWFLTPIEQLLRCIEMMRRVDRPLERGKLPIERGDEFGSLATALHELAVAGYRDRNEAGRLRRTLDSNVANATRNATAHLRLQALRDPLTELGNRRFMDEHVPAMFNLTRDNGQPMVCMVIDMDNFKRINDELGHAAGDTVLRRLADLLRACTREHDLAIRLGGDEFVLWLPGMSMARATELGDALSKLFKQQVHAMGPAARDAGISVGLASTAHDRADTPDQLLALADDRLYQIKHTGKGRVYGTNTPSASA